MTIFDRIAEERIQEAIERGVFDDLPTRGRPLALADLSHVPAELRTAYSLLKSANVLPEELELREELVSLQRMLKAVRDDGDDGEDDQHLRERLNDVQLRYVVLLEHRLHRPVPREYRARLATRMRP